MASTSAQTLMSSTALSTTRMLITSTFTAFDVSLGTTRGARWYWLSLRNAFPHSTRSIHLSTHACEQGEYGTPQHNVCPHMMQHPPHWRSKSM